MVSAVLFSRKSDTGSKFYAATHQPVDRKENTFEVKLKDIEKVSVKKETTQVLRERDEN